MKFLYYINILLYKFIFLEFMMEIKALKNGNMPKTIKTSAGLDIARWF